MKLQALGIDLSKTVFHLVGLDSSATVALQKARTGQECSSVEDFTPKEFYAQRDEMP